MLKTDIERVCFRGMLNHFRPISRCLTVDMSILCLVQNLQAYECGVGRDHFPPPPQHAHLIGKSYTNQFKT